MPTTAQTIHAHAHTLREKILSALESAYDPAIVKEFQNDQGEFYQNVSYRFQDSDTPNIRAIKAILNILFHVEQLTDDFSILKLINIADYVENMKAVAPGTKDGVGPLFQSLYTGSPELKQNIQEVLQGIESNSSLEQGDLTGMFGITDTSGKVNEPPTPEPEAWVAPAAESDDPILNAVMAVKTHIEGTIQSHFSESIRAQYLIKDEKEHYLIDDSDSLQVKNMKSLLNILTSLHETYRSYYYDGDKKNAISYYYNLYSLSKELGGAFAYLNMGGAADELVRDALIGLNLIMEGVAKYADEIEDHIGLKPGLLFNQFAPAYEQYYQALDTYALLPQLDNIPPYWKTRVDMRTRRMEPMIAEVHRLENDLENLNQLKHILDEHAYTPLHDIPIEQIRFIHDNLHRLNLKEEEKRTYVRYLNNRLENPDVSAGFFGVFERLANFSGLTEHSVIIDKTNEAHRAKQAELAITNRHLSVMRHHQIDAKEKLQTYNETRGMDISIMAAAQMFNEAEASAPNFYNPPSPAKAPSPLAKFAKRAWYQFMRVVNFISFGALGNYVSRLRDNLTSQITSPIFVERAGENAFAQSPDNDGPTEPSPIPQASSSYGRIGSASTPNGTASSLQTAHSTPDAHYASAVSSVASDASPTQTVHSTPDAQYASTISSVVSDASSTQTVHSGHREAPMESGIGILASIRGMFARTPEAPKSTAVHNLSPQDRLKLLGGDRSVLNILSREDHPNQQTSPEFESAYEEFFPANVVFESADEAPTANNEFESASEASLNTDRKSKP